MHLTQSFKLEENTSDYKCLIHSFKLHRNASDYMCLTQSFKLETLLTTCDTIN